MNVASPIGRSAGKGYYQGPDFDDVKICKKCSIK
jgi:hypothetical protein